MDSLQRSSVNMPALSDVLCEANALHDVLIQTCTDDLIEETAPIVMAVAWELRSKMATPDGNERTEVFGTLLALWAMLRHPEAIRAATQRLYDRLCEEMGHEDTEMLMLLGQAPRSVDTPRPMKLDRETYIAAAVADPDVRQRIRNDLTIELAGLFGRMTGEFRDG